MMRDKNWDECKEVTKSLKWWEREREREREMILLVTTNWATEESRATSVVEKNSRP